MIELERVWEAYIRTCLHILGNTMKGCLPGWDVVYLGKQIPNFRKNPTPTLFNVEIVPICQAKLRHIPVNVNCHCHLQNPNSHSRIGTQNIRFFDP